jgi:lipid II:glycine glycyltransferase (peptidoglycan interpeptide bridge formation enzyme)
MAVKILDLSQEYYWNEYLIKLPKYQQDIYFTPEYYKILNKYGDGEALCFVYYDNDNIALYPFFKNSVNKLGYKLDSEYFDIQGAYGYNGVLSNCQEEEFKANFFKSFNTFCQEENIIAEFTRFHPLLNNYTFSGQNMEIVYDRKTVFLDITKSNDDIWNNSYSSNNRNMIRKSLKNNIEIIEGGKEEDYIAFYKIYVETMLNVGSEKYLFFNEKYFLDFMNLLPNNHRIIFAKYNNNIIGGMILMMYKTYAHYHLSCRKTDYGRFALNNLLLDYAIKLAQKEGCKFFHFGGGTSSNEEDSLLKFKSNFSKSKIDFYIGKKIHNSEIYKTVVSSWEKKNEHKTDKLKNVLLKYRM